MGLITTPKTLLKKALNLLESDEVEWTQGTLAESKDGHYLDFYFGQFRHDGEVVPPAKVGTACLMGAIDLAAVQFVKPERIDSVVQEAFDLLAKTILTWGEAGETLRQEYKDHIAYEQKLAEKHGQPFNPPSFDEYQIENYLSDLNATEDTISDFNDANGTSFKDALAVLRKAING